MNGFISPSSECDHHEWKWRIVIIIHDVEVSVNEPMDDEVLFLSRTHISCLWFLSSSFFSSFFFSSFFFLLFPSPLLVLTTYFCSFSFLLHLVIFPHFVPDSLLDPFFIQLCVHCVCYDQRTEHITRLIETLILSLSSTFLLFFLVLSFSLSLWKFFSCFWKFLLFGNHWPTIHSNRLRSSISCLIKCSSKERRKGEKNEN